MSEKCRHCGADVPRGQEAFEFCEERNGYIVWHEHCANAQGVEVIMKYFDWADLTWRWGL